MKKTIFLMSLASVILTLGCLAAYIIFKAEFFYAAMITFLTISYHFLMRLAVGYLVNMKMRNTADLSSRWYRNKEWENRLYRFLRVKKWKAFLPTFESESFNPKTHSWSEIAQAMCQAEIVHEIIIVLSFIPILFSIPFGTAPVFIVTSILAALFDSIFVITQRYNRLRIMKMINRR